MTGVIKKTADPANFPNAYTSPPDNKITITLHVIKTFKKIEKISKKLLTNENVGGILHKHSRESRKQ